MVEGRNADWRETIFKQRVHCKAEQQLQPCAQTKKNVLGLSEHKPELFSSSLVQSEFAALDLLRIIWTDCPQLL